MKGKLAVGIILLALMQLVACERNDVDTSADKISTLELERIKVASNTSIQKGDPVLFVLENGLSPLNFQWKISPRQNVLVAKSDSVATVFFPQSGTYTVTALDSISQDSVSFTVDIVINDNRDDNIETHQNFDLDDIIRLTPITFPDSAFHLEFYAETKNTYNCTDNYLLFHHEKVQDTFKINFQDVVNPAGCKTEKARSKRYIYVNEFIEENKTYSLEITLNNITYNGTFERKGAKYEFTWPHTTGVILTKKSL